MSNSKEPTRTTYIGGQAVMEGVMMRGRSTTALSVRKHDKSIETVVSESKSPIKKKSLLSLPIIRGVVSFVGGLVIGMKALYQSADLCGLSEMEEDEEPSKFDRWLEAKLGDKLTDVIMAFSAVIAIALSVALFFVLPSVISSACKQFFDASTRAMSIIESLSKVLIFVGYLFIISRMKEIRRTFQYHGAEHKTINCYESGDELTVENVRKHTRLHKRCSTSFLMFTVVVSIVVFLFIRTTEFWPRLISRILLIPVVAGLSFEIISWAGRSKSPLVNIVSWPGLKLQLLTTQEPEDDQIEVAIAAMKAVLEREGDGWM